MVLLQVVQFCLLFSGYVGLAVEKSSPSSPSDGVDEKTAALSKAILDGSVTEKLAAKREPDGRVEELKSALAQASLAGPLPEKEAAPMADDPALVTSALSEQPVTLPGTLPETLPDKTDVSDADAKSVQRGRSGRRKSAPGMIEGEKSGLDVTGLRRGSARRSIRDMLPFGGIRSDVQSAATSDSGTESIRASHGRSSARILPNGREQRSKVKAGLEEKGGLHMVDSGLTPVEAVQQNGETPEEMLQRLLTVGNDQEQQVFIGNGEGIIRAFVCMIFPWVAMFNHRVSNANMRTQTTGFEAVSDALAMIGNIMGSYVDSKQRSDPDAEGNNGETARANEYYGGNAALREVPMRKNGVTFLQTIINFLSDQFGECSSLDGARDGLASTIDGWTHKILFVTHGEAGTVKRNADDTKKAQGDAVAEAVTKIKDVHKWTTDKFWDLLFLNQGLRWITAVAILGHQLSHVHEYGAGYDSDGNRAFRMGWLSAVLKGLETFEGIVFWLREKKEDDMLAAMFKEKNDRWQRHTKLRRQAREAGDGAQDQERVIQSSEPLPGDAMEDWLATS